MKIIKTTLSEYYTEAKSIFDKCFPGQDFDFNIPDKNNPLYLAFVDDVPVGMCMTNETDLGAGSYPCIYNLCVLLDHRYRGIGYALVNAVPTKCYIISEKQSKVTRDFSHMGYRLGYNVLSRGITVKSIGGLPDSEHYNAKQNIIYLN